MPAGRLQFVGSRRIRLRWLDTFDWRLHRSGHVLEEIVAPGRSRLRLRPLTGGAPIATQPGPASRFARRLHPGPVRERIVDCTEPRALLALAEAEIFEEVLALHTAGARRPVRLVLERCLVGPPGTKPHLPLKPVLRGPRRRAFLFAGIFASRSDARPDRTDLLTRALDPLGRAPRDYSGKIHVTLEPTVRAGAAARAILSRLLANLEANLPGLRGDIDPEFLHDFRVAVRRSRAFLGQVRGVLPPATTERARRELAWLQEVSGPSRDLDVYLFDLPGLSSLLPPRYRRSLGPLRRIVERGRLEARSDLLSALDSRRFASFLGWWRAFIAHPAPRRAGRSSRALEPAREIAARRLRRLHRRALLEGSAIVEHSPPSELHELRKTCKKLRYLIEFFRSLYDPVEADRFVASLKALQDLLGRHQDLQVQAARLVGYARALATERAASPAAFLAMGMLVERLREEQAAARRNFSAQFAEFSRPGNSRRFKRLLGQQNQQP